MKLKRLKIRGVLAFRSVDIDWEALPDGLVAVVGPNGAGKSTLMDCTMASLFRQMPSRERSIYDYAHGKDSLIEAHWGDCVMRLELNAAQRTMRPFVLSQSRAPLTDGKAEFYDELISKMFPPLPVMLATVFAAQNGKGSFRTLSRSGRKDLFSKLLQNDHYDRLAELARERSTKASKEVLALESKVEMLKQDEEHLAEYTRAVVEHKEQLAKETASIKRREAHGAENDAALVTIREDMAETRARLEEHERTHAAKVQAREAAEAAVAEACEAEQAAKRRNLKAIAMHEAEKRRIRNALHEASEIIRSDAPEDPNMAQLEDEAEDAKKFCDATQRTYDQKREMHRLAKDGELVKLVPCEGKGKYEGCQLLKNAVEAYKESKGKTPAESEKESKLAYERLDAARRRVAETEKAVRRGLSKQGTFKEWSAIYDAAGLNHAHAMKEMVDETSTWEKTCEEAIEEARQLNAKVTAARKALDALPTNKAISAERENLLQRSTRLALNEDRLKQEQRQVNQDICMAQSRAERERVALAVAEREVERIKGGIQRQKDLAARAAHHRKSATRFDVLATAFGRTGIPVLEIDAAGPHVSAQTNALLRASFGDRFTVRLETQTAKADGSGMKETFDLSVWDSVAGGRRELTDLSGGEQVIVDECLKAALALHVKQNHQQGHLPMCWRDETTGALDGENIDRYIQMLRALKKLGGFDQVVFVTHSPEAAALADARLVVGGGKVKVT